MKRLVIMVPSDYWHRHKFWISLVQYEIQPVDDSPQRRRKLAFLEETSEIS